MKTIIVAAVSKVIAAAFIGAPVYADPTTTEEVGRSATHLATTATCQEVIESIASIGTASPTEELLLLFHNVVIFGWGYAFAKGMPPGEATNEIMARCLSDPSLPFAGLSISE